MIERLKDKYGAGGVALFIILLTITIAIVGYVMANGSNPIGPTTSAAINVNELTVSRLSTPVATSVETLNFNSQFAIVGATAQADISLSDTLTVADALIADQVRMSGVLSTVNPSVDQLHSLSAGNVAFSARGEIRLNIDTNSNGSECMRVVADLTTSIMRACEGAFIEFNGISRLEPQSISCVDSGDANPATLTLLPTRSLILLTPTDTDGCDVTLSETGMISGNRIHIVNMQSFGGVAMNFAYSDGIQETGGITLPVDQYGWIGWVYATDRWVYTSCTLGFGC